MLLFSNGPKKSVGMVCVCVCWGGGRVLVWEGGVYHIQRLTNLPFSQDLYKKKQNDDWL